MHTVTRAFFTSGIAAFAVVLGGARAASNTNGQEALNTADLEPLHDVTEIVRWFNALNDTFDQLTLVAQHKQLESKVDKMRKDLYQLETGSQDLLDQIPNSRPTGAKQQQLLTEDQNLLKRVKTLKTEADALGADIRLHDGTPFEKIERFAMHGKKAALEKTQSALTSQSAWDADDIRAELKDGIDAVRTAQIAATTFVQKLAAHQ
ncbi:hypothetical protein [Caballeronia sp. KNU42]